MEGKTQQDVGGDGRDERALCPQVAAAVRCRRRPRPGAGGAPGLIPSVESGRRRSCPCSRARPLAGSGQRQLLTGWRSSIPRPVQRLAAAHSATTITGLEGAQRPGPGGLLPPGASPGPRGPAGLHPLQLPGGDHRRAALSPPAVSVGAEPFGVALRRGVHRGDLPGPEAGAAERPVGAGRCAQGDPLGQHLGRHPRDAAQPRPGPERQLRRAPGALRARVHPDQFRRVPRKRSRRAGPLQAQGRHRPGTHAAGAAAISDTIDDYTGFVSKVVDRRNRLVQEKLEQERAHTCNSCRQLRCRSTSTTGPGCASGAPFRQLEGPTPFPHGSSGKEVQIRLYAGHLEV